MQRYAHEEVRNRGIEEAARLIERCNMDRRSMQVLTAEIRSLKRDPQLQLGDWWGAPLDLHGIDALSIPDNAIGWPSPLRGGGG